MNSSLIRIATIGAGALVLAGSVAISAAPRAHPTRTAGAMTPARTMTFAALEQRALAMGIEPTELKIKYYKAEIEGRDRQGRKIEVKLDPQTGAELARKFDD